MEDTSFEEIRNRINRVLDMNMAVPLEFKTNLNNLTREEWMEKYWSDPEIDGLMNHVLLLSDEEFKNYQREMKKVLNKPWEANSKHGSHSGNVFFVGFFKNVEK